MITIARQLSAAYPPISALMISKRVYGAIRSNSDKSEYSATVSSALGTRSIFR
jgi:adenosylmethionine-8-amino-7-oxononanoate aminotransferase